MALQVDKEPDDKGKPLEREGRKAMGLSLIRGMIARLPKQGLFLKTRTESSNSKKGAGRGEDNCYRLNGAGNPTTRTQYNKI